MGRQYNKAEKKKRRGAYIARKKLVVKSLKTKSSGKS